MSSAITSFFFEEKKREKILGNENLNYLIWEKNWRSIERPSWLIQLYDKTWRILEDFDRFNLQANRIGEGRCCMHEKLFSVWWPLPCKTTHQPFSWPFFCRVVREWNDIDPRPDHDQAQLARRGGLGKWIIEKDQMKKKKKIIEELTDASCGTRKSLMSCIIFVVNCDISSDNFMIIWCQRNANKSMDGSSCPVTRDIL